MPCPLAEAIQAQSIWTNKAQYVDAERKFHSKLQSDAVNVEESTKPISENSKKNNKKGKKSNADAEPSDTVEQTVTDTPKSSFDKKNKNDKNAKKQQQQQQQQQQQIEKNTNEEATATVADDSKQSAKAKKQKAKKEKKSAKKQLEDSNKSNVSSISEDISSTSEKRDLPKSKSKLKPETPKATKEKHNAKHDLVKDENTKVHVSGGVSEECTLVSEIAKARQHLKNSLERMDDIAALAGKDVLDRISALEKENASLHQVVNELKKLQLQSENRIKSLEERLTGVSVSAPAKAPAAPAAAPAKQDDDDDDVDLFGSDEEDEEAARIREERLSAYAAKKSKKPALIAKSSVLLDVKPWDDETDMKKMEENVRTVEMEGLVWGASKLVPVGYGINKLQIMCVIEDEKVSTDELQEKIEAFEDYVQSVDIAAFNKI
ncbi:elongation factor 1-delta-like [Sitodiplosis mosellana]|uniref:elongation factor 1-delta-like n=1 Tax=Sitodiplosis mosellana TaxID=263140 RepID=UPI0024438875|nr:elongation factor 1-delta-like [Sitodiplosis mosellana]